MGIRSMQGTSSHLEYIGPKGRKHRKNCIFYKNNKCICKKSQAYLMKCIGRLCCGQYNDSEEAKEALESETRELLKYKNTLTRHQKHLNKRSAKKKNKVLPSKGIISIDDNRNPLLGKKIKLKSLKMKEELTIEIVKIEQESIFNRRYSINSNFGMALLGKKVGDIIRINVVNGYLAYEILSME